MQQQQITQLVHTFLKVFRCLYKLVGILLTVSLEHIYISMNNIICVKPHKMATFYIQRYDNINI